jgi:hypothetical protein
VLVCVLNRSRTQTTGCSFCSSMSFHDDDDDDAKCQRSTTCYVSSVCRLPVHTTTTIYFYQQRRLDGGSLGDHTFTTPTLQRISEQLVYQRGYQVVQKVFTVLCLASWDLRAYMRSAIQVFTPPRCTHWLPIVVWTRAQSTLYQQNVRGITRSS